MRLGYLDPSVPILDNKRYGKLQVVNQGIVSARNGDFCSLSGSRKHPYCPQTHQNAPQSLFTCRMSVFLYPKHAERIVGVSQFRPMAEQRFYRPGVGFTVANVILQAKGDIV
jgi:hypothetical protein